MDHVGLITCLRLAANELAPATDDILTTPNSHYLYNLAIYSVVNTI